MLDKIDLRKIVNTRIRRFIILILISIIGFSSYILGTLLGVPDQFLAPSVLVVCVILFGLSFFFDNHTNLHDIPFRKTSQKENKNKRFLMSKPDPLLIEVQSNNINISGQFSFGSKETTHLMSKIDPVLEESIRSLHPLITEEQVLEMFNDIQYQLAIHIEDGELLGYYKEKPEGDPDVSYSEFIEFMMNDHEQSIAN